MTRKTAAYWEGYNAEAARHGRAGDVASLAQQVSQALGRDNARKQRIIARSPGVFSSMDAAEFGSASSAELAARELKELGIEPGENDPLAILDAHHAGRKYARDKISFAGIKGGAASAKGLLGGDGSAHDSAEDFIDRYINE